MWEIKDRTVRPILCKFRHFNITPKHCQHNALAPHTPCQIAALRYCIYSIYAKKVRTISSQRYINSNSKDFTKHRSSKYSQQMLHWITLWHRCEVLLCALNNRTFVYFVVALIKRKQHSGPKMWRSTKHFANYECRQQMSRATPNETNEKKKEIKKRTHAQQSRLKRQESNKKTRNIHTLWCRWEWRCHQV